MARASPEGYRAKANLRPDHNGPQRAQFESNKRKIFASQRICGICGQPVDFSRKFPDPMSPCIDHIVPVAKGGHPSDITNLQLAHMCCNRLKSDKLTEKREFSAGIELVSNRLLPLTYDWATI
jgi:5-methylcytosine-specific restriction endonuclease McrA